MRRVGIYPGSFDPVHEGHLAFAKAALTVGKLEKVVFLPEKRPRGKPRVSALDVRLSVLWEKTNQNKQLQVMSLPMERFSVANTLAVLQEKFDDARLVLLVGSDIVHTFQYRWSGLDMLLRSADLIIGLRDGDVVQDIEKLIASLETKLNYRITYSVTITPYAHLASSKIRQSDKSVADIG